VREGRPILTSSPDAMKATGRLHVLLIQRHGARFVRSRREQGCLFHWVWFEHAVCLERALVLCMQAGPDDDDRPALEPQRPWLRTASMLDWSRSPNRCRPKAAFTARIRLCVSVSSLFWSLLVVRSDSRKGCACKLIEGDSRRLSRSN